MPLDEGLRLLRSKRAPNMVDAQAAMELISAKVNQTWLALGIK